GFASLLAVSAALVAPQASAFTSGGWEGHANNDDDGTFRDCTMTADYANGITLAFIISRDYGWGLVLADDQWDLKAGSAEPIKLTVDQLPPIPGTAKIIDVHGILIPLDNADPVVDAMRHGQRLSVVAPAGEVRCGLCGARDAVCAWGA